MQFGNSAGNFGVSAFRLPFGNDSTDGLSILVALLPNSMQIVHNWSEKGVYSGETTVGIYYIPTVVSPLLFTLYSLLYR